MSTKKVVKICEKSDMLVNLQTAITYDTEDTNGISGTPKNGDEKGKDKPQSVETQLLWKLYLGRKEGFKGMNNDVEHMVSECLKAHRRLECVEDSNRNLRRELSALRTKYEAMLEKNKKDTGIILALQNSESMLKQSTGKKEKTSECLLTMRMKNKERALQRKLLQDEQSRLLLKSQADSNTLYKINRKHQKMQEEIEEQCRITNGDNILRGKELEDIRACRKKDEALLEEWRKTDEQRNALICTLQENMKSGLVPSPEKNSENVAVDEEEKEEPSSETAESNKPKSEGDSDNAHDKTSTDATQNPREKALRSAWLKKNILYDSAQKLKEHWNHMYEMTNKRIFELNVDQVNVRQWRLDREAEKRELLERTERMEQLVSQKRRNRPVPTRSLINELEIRIKMQREMNETLRKIASKYMFVRSEGSVKYFEFQQFIRSMFVEALMNENDSKNSKTDGTTPDEQVLETENKD